MSSRSLRERLSLPVICSPMFIVGNPRLLIEQCKAGVVGSMPALNARPASQLDEWLAQITEELAAYDRAHPQHPAAPFAINQIVHRSNDRLDALGEGDPSTMNFGDEGRKAKAWKDIWGAGQGIGAIREVSSAAEYIAKLEREYHAARERLTLEARP
jgi:NAD(P)H-dependent flavin oxidoreductase YrpB (nitropropane dioxygenase family)